MPSEAFEYVVVSKYQETYTTSTLYLSRPDGSIPPYLPGQYLTVYFSDLSPTLGKLYSISSAPSEGKLALTVKVVGRFSKRLASLDRGDRLVASRPHGSFVRRDTRPAILIGGGMGITPLRSIATEASFRGGEGVALFYSAKFSGDMPFGSELYELSKRSRLLLEQFVTKESAPANGVKARRMRFDDVIAALTSLPDAEFLVSGSLSFALAQRSALVGAGIPRSDILTEIYF